MPMMMTSPHTHTLYTIINYHNNLSFSSLPRGLPCSSPLPRKPKRKKEQDRQSWLEIYCVLLVLAAGACGGGGKVLLLLLHPVSFSLSFFLFFSVSDCTPSSFYNCFCLCFVGRKREKRRGKCLV